MKNKPIIAVSILTANFINLKKQLNQIIKSGIEHIHFDVMDNHFVNNLTFGPKILSDINSFLKNKNIKIDCHLMVEINSKFTITKYLKPYIESKVNNITLHYEALSQEQLNEFLDLKENNLQKGLAINPDTSITNIIPYLSKLDFVLIMAVNPGFGKQKFLEATIEKIKELKNITNKVNKDIIIAVDGGINDISGIKCINAGANYLVSGSYLLNNGKSIKKQLKKITNNE